MSEERLRIKVAVIEGHPLFIFWINGRATINDLRSIEDDLNNHENDFRSDVEGKLLDLELAVSRFEGQFNEYGMVELAPGWEFEEIGRTITEEKQP